MLLVDAFEEEPPRVRTSVEVRNGTEPARLKARRFLNVRCCRLSARLRPKGHLQGATNARWQAKASSKSGWTNLFAFSQGSGRRSEHRLSWRLPSGAPPRKVDCSRERASVISAWENAARLTHKNHRPRCDLRNHDCLATRDALERSRIPQVQPCAAAFSRIIRISCTRTEDHL